MRRIDQDASGSRRTRTAMADGSGVSSRVPARLIFDFRVEGEVPSTNRWERYHWGKKKRMKDDWWFLIGAAIKRRIIDLNTNHPLTAGPSSFRIVQTTHHRKRLVDSDNLTSATKTLITDALKRYYYSSLFGKKTRFERQVGLIYDDSTKYAEIQQPEQVKLPSGWAPYVEVRILDGR